MGEGIDLPTLSRLTGIPHGTLRYWVSEHRITAVGSRRSVLVYSLAQFKPYLLAWAERKAKAAA